MKASPGPSYQPREKKAGSAKPQTRKRAQAQQNGWAQMLIWATLGLGVVVSAWLWKQKSANPPQIPPGRFFMTHRFLPSWTGMPRQPESDMGDRRTMGFQDWRPGGGGNFMPSPYPRYVANFTTRFGEYFVSVRQVIGDEYQNLYQNPTKTTVLPALSRIAFSIQIMAEKPEAIARIRDFATQVRAVDDTGHPLDLVEFKPTTKFRDGNGMARIVRMSVPAANARYIKSLEGDIQLEPNGASASAIPQGIPLDGGTNLASGTPSPEKKGKKPTSDSISKTFHIENIALPNTTHIFGMVSARYLTPAQLAAAHVETARLENGVRFLSGAQLDSVKKYLPPSVPEAAPIRLPSRLILVQDVANNFFLPAPVDPKDASVSLLQCKLTPRLDADGEIPFVLELSADNASSPFATAHVRGWDSYPLAVVIPPDRLPANAKPGRSLVVSMRLYLDMTPEQMFSFPPHPPFQAGKGERGGLMVGQVLMQNDPMSMGQIQLEITPIRPDGSPMRDTASIAIPLDKGGQWRFANMSPGYYRVKLKEAHPYLSRITPTSPMAEYFRRRYGINNPVWANGSQDRVFVRPGGQTNLQPIRLVDKDSHPQNEVALQKVEKTEDVAQSVRRPQGLTGFEIERAGTSGKLSH